LSSGLVSMHLCCIERTLGPNSQSFTHFRVWIGIWSLFEVKFHGKAWNDLWIRPQGFVRKLTMIDEWICDELMNESSRVYLLLYFHMNWATWSLIEWFCYWQELRSSSVLSYQNAQFTIRDANISVHWISFCEFSFGTVLYSGGITWTCVYLLNCRWSMFMHVCDVRPFSNFILTRAEFKGLFFWMKKNMKIQKKRKICNNFETCKK
jgi:hypothetical protein